MENDLYDVSKYTDQQLYDILDINNPTDRELEARIVYLVNKYSAMQNESGYKLAVFFQNIYSRFFDLDTDIVEGFEPLEIEDINNRKKYDATYYDSNGNTLTKEELQNILKTDISYGQVYSKKIGNELVKDNKPATSQDIQSTFTLDYTKDKFGLNPLLKQTIKRIICIDSQYRDNKNISLSSEFTFNLSEPLRDVVSLKLESIQIPITWYTISNGYGSNFLYLKGISDGINNGLHDYKIEIKAGNYSTTSTDSTTNIISVINSSINDISNIYTDVNFGTTSISYNNGNSKISLNIDIQKIYNESCFQLKFPYWTPSNTSDSRLLSIPSYLGFNSSIYYPFSISSNQSRVLTPNNNNNFISFEVDISNNFFNIINYEGVDEYNSNSTILNNFKINITNGTYYRNSLLSEINTQLKNAIFLDSSYSQIEEISIIDPSMLNVGNSYYRMSIKFNRYIVKQKPNSKMVIIFPDESMYNRNSIWTIIQGKESGLFFDSIQNETNIIYAESNSIQSSFPVSGKTYIYYKCISPSNYASTTDFSMNDIKVNIPPGNYIINDYISEINKSFTSLNTITGKNIFNTNNMASTDNSIFKLNNDITNNFTSGNWNITINTSSVLYTILNLPIKTNASLSDSINFFDGSFNNKTDITDPYIFNSGYIMTISPKTQYGNKRDISYNISLPYQVTYTYSTFSQLLEDIKKSITNFSVTNNIEKQFPLSTCYFSNPIISDDNLRVNIKLFININYFLTENNYEIYFNDDINNDISQAVNSWHKINIDYSYNLYEKKIPQDPYGESSNYSTIKSNNISISLLTINNNNNTINIKPFEDSNGGSYTEENDIFLKIPNGDYTKYQLITKINELMDNDNRLYGSKFISYVKNNSEFIKVYMNINIIYTSKDYKIVFYDPYSFIKCFSGSKSIKNTTWDSTLGWILGFKDYTEYELKKTNENGQYYLESINGVYIYTDILENDIIINTNISLTGDTSCTLNIYNYFMIILDDYIQNHLNDGLVSITKKETNIELPSYSSQSIKICDPVTNTKTISTTTNGLTSKQIYSLNQSLISRRNSIKNYSSGTSIKDIFAMIPLKIGGIPNGSYYVETGGNLQNQERVYFGPVNIQRMSIKLVNDRGVIVDLNKVDWSFSFICEQLYRT